MTLFRPSVPKVPRDEADPSAEVSCSTYRQRVRVLIVYRNARLAAGVKKQVRCSSANHVTMRITELVSILL